MAHGGVSLMTSPQRLYAAGRGSIPYTPIIVIICFFLLLLLLDYRIYAKAF
jgi:hypothetical protein